MQDVYFKSFSFSLSCSSSRKKLLRIIKIEIRSRKTKEISLSLLLCVCSYVSTCSYAKRSSFFNFFTSYFESWFVEIPLVRYLCASRNTNRNDRRRSILFTPRYIEMPSLTPEGTHTHESPAIGGATSPVQSIHPSSLMLRSDPLIMKFMALDDLTFSNGWSVWENCSSSPFTLRI